MVLLYGLRVDGIIYTHRPDVEGEQYTLVTAMQDAKGTGNAQVVRCDAVLGRWVVVVDRAGSSHDAVHVASGHRFDQTPSRVRRWAVWGRTGWNRRRATEIFLAEMRAQSQRVIDRFRADAARELEDLEKPVFAVVPPVIGKNVSFHDVKRVAQG
jgi:hypothetical protein